MVDEQGGVTPHSWAPDQEALGLFAAASRLQVELDAISHNAGRLNAIGRYQCGPKVRTSGSYDHNLWFESTPLDSISAHACIGTFSEPKRPS